MNLANFTFYISIFKFCFVIEFYFRIKKNLEIKTEKKQIFGH